ncbi:MAG: hypothetical protein IT536_20495 [Hyphomicrobiales bacterium]|nr:hypothetical protein [Hyphomicrobiales bacterium]
MTLARSRFNAQARLFVSGRTFALRACERKAERQEAHHACDAAAGAIPLVTLPYPVERNHIPMMIVQHHPSDDRLRRAIDRFARLAPIVGEARCPLHH